MTAIERREANQLDFSGEKLAFLRRHYAKDANDIEFEHFVSVCRARRLSPELNQIYWTKVRDRPTIIVSIEGYRLIADRTGLYAGSQAGAFTYDDAGKPLSCSVTVMKIVQDLPREFTAVARMSEQYRDVKNWRDMPCTMLEKCAEAKALRKAFPEELGGTYTDDEVRGIPTTDLESETKRTATAFSVANGKSVAWLHKTLQSQGIPSTQWGAIARELDGATEADFRERFQTAVQRAKEST
jgi:phage recombination protein Bet